MALYPSQWEHTLVLRNGTRVLARPIRWGDESRLQALLQHVRPSDLRLRFFATIKVFSDEFVSRLTHVDYVNAMAFVAVDETDAEILGVVRLHMDSTGQQGEYAVLVKSDLKGTGLGWALMQLIVEYAKSRKLAFISGQVLSENRLMLDMCRELGFEITANVDDPVVCDVKLKLQK